MISIDGKRTNLEGGDELLERELALLIALTKSRLQSKGRSGAEANEFIRKAVEKSEGDMDRLREKAQIEKDREKWA